MSRPAENLTGRKFGQLTALERIGANKHGHAFWLCECDCGKQHKVTANNLKMGLVSSCGCSRRMPRNRANLNILNKV